MKNCLFCKYFLWMSGSKGYSEYTPGSSWHMECTKEVWDEQSLFYEDIRELLSKAVNCEFYVVNDWAVKRYPHLLGE